MKIGSVCTYVVYLHLSIDSPNAELGGTSYLRRNNISAAEPRPKAWMLRVLLAARDNALFGGSRRNAHHSAAPLPFIFHRVMLILSVSSLLTWDVGLLKIGTPLQSLREARSRGAPRIPPPGRCGSGLWFARRVCPVG